MYQSNIHSLHFYDNNKSSTPTSSNQEHDPPLTSKWAQWAQEEESKVPAVVSTFNTPTQSPTLSYQQPSPKRTTSSTRLCPTKEELDLVSNEPILCFCKKEAHKSYTLEYGPILECHSYSITTNSKRSKYTCLFHVHETSWRQFRADLLNNKTISSDCKELRSCPLYNFTFCTLFYTSNAFDKVPPTVLPDCFCKKPVKLKHVDVHTQPKLIFTCANLMMEGSKRCSWRLEAKEVAFPKPKHRIHIRVEREVYERKHDICEKRSLPQRQSSSSSSRSEEDQHQDKQRHQHDLLATLSATQNNSSSPTAAAVTNDGIIDFEQLAVKSHNQLVIPTSVLSQQRTHQQLKPVVLSASTSDSSTTTSSAFSSLTVLSPKLSNNSLHHDLAEMRALNTQLKIELNASRDMIKTMREKLEDETVFRLNSQELLSNIQLEMVHLMSEKEKVIEDLANFKEATHNKYGKEDEYNKCKVCFNRPIEYALVPCYHLAFCQQCASKLKECAICRRPHSSIQKIFRC